MCVDAMNYIQTLLEGALAAEDADIAATSLMEAEAYIAAHQIEGFEELVALAREKAESHPVQ